jgi:hypothetical protein
LTASLFAVINRSSIVVGEGEEAGMGGEEDNALTLGELAQRLETLERENAALQEEVTELRGLATSGAD